MTVKNKYFMIFILGLMILACINRYASSAELFYRYAALLFTNPSFAFAQFSFELLDIIASVILPLLIIVFAAVSRMSILQNKLNFLSVTIILLMLVFMFPGLIAGESPEFYSNLKSTKLLSPFSTVQKISTQEESSNLSNEDKFVSLKKELIMSSAGSIKYLPYNNHSTGKSVKKVFLLGTDEYGRDIFTRIIFGARISFITGLLSVLVTLLIGLPLGFAAGFSGPAIDAVLNKAAEMFLSIPMIFLIILFAAFFGSSIIAVIILLGFSGWMSLFKIVRGEILLIEKKDFFIASKSMGLSFTSLLMKEVLPLISIPVIINLIFQFGNVILAEAALSYLGLSSGSSYPSWGGMIQEGQSYLYLAWWMIVFPGLLLFLSLFTINSLGKKLNIHFNPRLQYDK